MWYERLLEKNLIPDFLIRIGIRSQLKQKLNIEQSNSEKSGFEQNFVDSLKASPIAVATADANEQHYELPPAFFDDVLGAYKKYSCGLWNEGTQSIDESEKAMLDLYVERAEIEDGMSLLDLGCGWGSLSLYLAKRFPSSRVLGVSNSAPQKQDILAKAQSQGLSNLEIMTADMNLFEAGDQFDRILSIEMFEHMRNYEKLFKKVESWMKPEGKLFVHIFCHQKYPYLFDDKNPNNWMARYFFTGGIMPSKNLFRTFSEDIKVVKDWDVSGTHYQKTCEAWLKRMDAKPQEIKALFAKTYGPDQVTKSWVYWRIFFMACAELFGYDGGRQWFVGHYLFEKVRKPSMVES